MKILVVFLDMIRPNRLSVFNSKVKSDTQLDLSLKKIGEFVTKQTTYMHGGLREKQSNLMRRLYILKVLIFKKIF